MKILFRILGVLTLLISLFLCAIAVERSTKDAKEAKELGSMEELKTQIADLKKMSIGVTGDGKTEIDANITKVEGMMAAVRPASTYEMIGNIFIVMLILAIVAGILLFVVKKKAAMIVLGLTLVLAIAVISMSPDFSSAYGATSNRNIAYLASIPVILTALFAFLVGVKGPKVAVQR